MPAGSGFTCDFVCLGKGHPACNKATGWYPPLGAVVPPRTPTPTIARPAGPRHHCLRCPACSAPHRTPLCTATVLGRGNVAAAGGPHAAVRRGWDWEVPPDPTKYYRSGQVRSEVPTACMCMCLCHACRSMPLEALHASSWWHARMWPCALSPPTPPAGPPMEAQRPAGPRAVAVFGWVVGGARPPALRAQGGRPAAYSSWMATQIAINSNSITMSCLNGNRPARHRHYYLVLVTGLQVGSEVGRAAVLGQEA